MIKKGLFGRKIGNTRIIPISETLLIIFVCIIILSNFMTNFISLMLSYRQIIDLTNTVLVDQLKEVYTNAGNQYQLSEFYGTRDASIETLAESAKKTLSLPHSTVFGIKNDGTFLFYQNTDVKSQWSESTKKTIVSNLNKKFTDDIKSGSINFTAKEGEYFGVYKYQSDWDCYLVRAELRSDTKRETYRILAISGVLIIVITLLFLIIGIILFKHLFASIQTINDSLYEMQKNSELSIIDISKAPNNDITYLAASFNSLSTSVSTLMNIFKKFVSRDVVDKAYNDHNISLEGQQRELTILFSDIKSFTYRTETLGNEIIDVLNVHYNRAIRCIHNQDGVIGSIIGDAILAVFGTATHSKLKSNQAVKAGWDVTKVTADMRQKMQDRRKIIEKNRQLTEAEERVFKAVLIDVGIGIDGGKVFYGNIGSSEHMANTVIGDNVNSSSRLEGLTRVYGLPVITSEYVKAETEKVTDQYHFYEIDTVQVKGKTEGKKIYFPLDTEQFDSEYDRKYKIYEIALEAYYKGDWTVARKYFTDCELDLGNKMLARIGLDEAPIDWSGIWTMRSK